MSPPTDSGSSEPSSSTPDTGPKPLISILRRVHTRFRRVKHHFRRFASSASPAEPNDDQVVEHHDRRKLSATSASDNHVPVGDTYTDNLVVPVYPSSLGVSASFPCLSLRAHGTMATPLSTIRERGPSPLSTDATILQSVSTSKCGQYIYQKNID